MADSTIDDKEIILFDHWPGNANMQVPPYDSFTSEAARHDVDMVGAPQKANFYELGTKITVFCPGNLGAKGWSTFIYLELAPVTAENPTPAAKQVVVPVDADEVYKVSNDPDQCLLNTGSPLGAVMISAMSADAENERRRGWFWCGGVCPTDFVSDLDGTHACVNTVVPGPMMFSNLTLDQMGYALFAGATTTSVIGASLGTAD